ncbi:MDR family NADP-dependent oxidoreductase [Streptomyces odonnellii]|uniref:MDR family NADP-dependent oxidoreductase n=1 Tax=Streptomyces odonnellii TaxID=1417980 RepID=UPI0006264376|nr:NADP-dependent oxidoreductase [Streptomyces odonnellii]
MSERPSGPLEPRHFRAERVPVPPRGADEVLIRAGYVSVAPHARAVMQGPTYRPQLAVGEVIPSSVVGEVVEAPEGGPTPGTVVAAANAGWQEYSLVPLSAVRPLPRIGPLSHHLGLLGLNGLTGYFGMRSVAEVRPGQTVLVSGAAGGVGHLAGQIARVDGARVIGITSSDAKSAVLVDQLGFAAAVNRTSGTFVEELRAACPEGVDVYFDNVGGTVSDAVLPLLTHRARVVLVGVTSHYDADQPAPPSAALPVQAIAKSLRLEGFLVRDFAERWGTALEDLRAMASHGQVKVLEDIRDGLEAAPSALVGMMSGGNLGQLAVQLRPDPADWPTG